MIDVGSTQIVVACFAGTMIVVSAIGLLERVFSLDTVAERYGPAIVVAGWVLLGTLGVAMAGQLLTGEAVSVTVAFTGFVATLAWIFVEQSVMQSPDNPATPLGRWLLTRRSSSSNE
ncbi:hypothetical protein C483_19080 [Natrialba hulunbeirensis JCM 10989]|uniref:Uncharacterized protein n=1 Tax=Natrialba hulunbeirensis JCM 10989 TaxID=1227493 RepID=L9ZJP0_9EURY|nr:hypothetical protein [Natrialba hulunbeirensis]ELY86544.1 hypothetical protein C483_19080 [Natrialba hulunbeirensis JCM 10989]